MSVVIENDGSIPNPALYFKCRDDKEWMHHYTRFIEFVGLKARFDTLAFEEYTALSLREEELGVGVTDCGMPF
jgi:hypothetical protein